MIKDKTIAELVTEDFRKAEVFKKYGIDFCCGGKKAVGEVCEQKGVDFNTLESELLNVDDKVTNLPTDIQNWPLDKLADYVVENYHSYVRENIPMISAYCDKVAKVHGHANPEVIKIADLFREIAEELLPHMMKEEQILFPFIKQIQEADSNGTKLSTPPFGTIRNPINMMEMEHDTAGNVMKEISKLSANFTPPEHACNTYRVEYFKLQEFEENLHQHIHIENNILFPRAIKLEAKLLS